jgi:cell pole-organizing protein PopZ
MAEENSQEEPSMDDILSSIRTILSDDESGEAKTETGAEVEAVSEVVGKAEKSVIEKPARSGANPVPGPETNLAATAKTPEPDPVAGPDVGEDPTAGPVTSQQPSVSPSLENNILELTQQMIAQSPSDIGAGDTILSNGPSANSTDALQELAKALLSKRDIAIGNRDMTLEGLVREIIRPLLREWLDQNLPYLIERLVKKEIDHMVNRAERLDL